MDAECATPTPQAGSAPSSPEAGRIPIIIYLIDSLRCDRLGAYGCTRELTPNMDALARESIVFENAYAPAPWTLPSAVSIFTSTFPTEHGAVDETATISPRVEFLANKLKLFGYRSAAFSSNPLSGVTGGDSGYPPVVRATKRFDLKRVERWLDESAGSPFHLFLHTMEPHIPYSAPMAVVQRVGAVSGEQRTEINKLMQLYQRLSEAGVERVTCDPNDPAHKGHGPDAHLHAAQTSVPDDDSPHQTEVMKRLSELSPGVNALYDAQVATADEQLGALIDALKRRRIWDSCIFVLLSASGEELGDHGGWQHDQSLYEELIRVPLLVRVPSSAAAPGRVATTVRLIDLAPTVLDLIGVNAKVRDSCRGVSLVPVMREPDRTTWPEPVVVSVRRNTQKFYRPFKEQRGDVNVAVRNGGWKAIWNVETGGCELYDLATDPQERHNLAATRPEVANRLQETARAWLSREAPGWATASQPSRPSAAGQVDESK